MNRLQVYLRYRSGDERGWRDRFEEEIGAAGNYPLLAGRYAGMLDEVIRLVGLDRLLRLVDADAAIADAVEQAKDRAHEEATGRARG